MGRGRWRIEVDRALRARYFNLEIAMEPKRTGDGPKSLSPRVGGCVPAVTGFAKALNFGRQVRGQKATAESARRPIGKWKRMTEDGVRAADTAGSSRGVR